LSDSVRIAEGRRRKKPATRIPFLSKTADIGLLAEHFAAPCRLLRRFAASLGVFCGVSRHSGGAGPVSVKGVGKYQINFERIR
jgi:hypothetical protein